MSAATIYVALAALVAVNAILQPSFFAGSNLLYTMGEASPLIFATAAEALIILIAGIDLSIGAQISLINVVATDLMMKNITGGVIGALVIGAGMGLVAGILVAYVRLPSIIVTLALSSVWFGTALYIMPQPGGVVPTSFQQLATGWVPTLAVVGLLVWWAWLSRTATGRGMVALGTSELATVMAGLNAGRLKVVVFTVAGLLAAMAALSLTAISGSGDPQGGASYTLTAITAAVLGGVSLAGGRGNVYGAVAGALVLTTITNVVVFLGVSSFYQDVVQGALLIFALGLSMVTEGRRLNMAGIASATRRWIFRVG